MAGIFNNETRQYEESPWLMDGDWYEDEDGMLYIVPKGTDAEIDGPDNATLDNLNRFCRENSRNPSEVEASKLCLTRVGENLKRFNETDGYYHA